MTDAPFPWFGGKARAADLIWSRLGNVENYVEPFAGSLAVLLNRPHPPGVETVNDLDGYVANFWRAMRADPDGVAYHADWPVNECDLHARHLWLVNEGHRRVARLMGDPDYYDAKVAGWWVWGLCAWIGRGWCSGAGPWVAVDGELTKGGAGRGINRQLPHLGDTGQGINRRTDVSRDLFIRDWMRALCERLRDVRVACGDWQRVMTNSVLDAARIGITGIVLDPPYRADGHDRSVYRTETDVSEDVRRWAIEHGDNPSLRIALCGYESEHDMPPGWAFVERSETGGYANHGSDRTENRHRERVWFSPHCLRPDLVQPTLFSLIGE